MDSDDGKSKKISQSVRDSTNTQEVHATKSKLDWNQPETPAKVLSQFLKNVLHAAIASDLIR